MGKQTNNQQHNTNTKQMVCHLCKLPFFQLLHVATEPDGTKVYEHGNPKVMCIMARAKMITIEKAQARHQAAKKRELKKRLEQDDANR